MARKAETTPFQEDANPEKAGSVVQIGVGRSNSILGLRVFPDTILYISLLIKHHPAERKLVC